MYFLHIVSPRIVQNRVLKLTKSGHIRLQNGEQEENPPNFHDFSEIQVQRDG